MSDGVRGLLERHGQDHLLAGWDQLDPKAQRGFLEQVEAVDWEQLERLLREDGDGAVGGDGGSLDWIDRAGPPPLVVAQPATDGERGEWKTAAGQGEQLLGAGRVAVVTVAGGQGTRLGFDHPKGLFPLLPVSGKTLFDHFAESIRARGRRAGRTLPWLVMTSDATHEETEAFFRERDFLGLDPGDVFLFRQGNMPAVDAGTGRVLLAAPGRLATSPDGHGGILAALQRAGLLELLAERGVDTLFYHQVDNPTVLIADPALLGWHQSKGSQATTRIVPKRSAEERMGVVVGVDGGTRIVEYSDLSDDQARRTDEDGGLTLWAGNTGVHVFDRGFLEQVSAADGGLPFHRAHKEVPYLDETGTLVTPAAANAIKFERFIFDLLPLAETALVVESDRAREFNPVKNADGGDSPETARQALSRNFRGWLEEVGAEVAEGVAVEISPLFALDAAELRGQVATGTRFAGPVCLGEADREGSC